MHLNYFTIKAVSLEWNASLADGLITEAYSQEKGELSLVIQRHDEISTLKFSTAAFRFFFRQEALSRARRNVAELFQEAWGCRVDRVFAAERDRVMFCDLSDGFRLQIQLYGPRPNIFLTSDGRVVRAFRNEEQWIGKEPPAPRPAELIEEFEQFRQRWKGNGKKAVQILSRAMPLFDRLMAEETLTRAGIDPETKSDFGLDDLRHIFLQALVVKSACEKPEPVIFWDGDRPLAFSLTPLICLKAHRSEPFSSVDLALSVFVRKTLGAQQFRDAFLPLEQRIRKATERLESRTERTREELRKESRADQYEHWAHLLMASPKAEKYRGDRLQLPDILGDGSEIEVPLDRGKSLIENAEQYYDKARKSRQARQHAETRLSEMEKTASRGRALLKELENVNSLRQLKEFQTRHADLVQDYLQDAGGDGESVPFRRFLLNGEYEVLVGRNARQNDSLTFHYAGKHDFWFHARGLPGSHVILKRSNKSVKPPKYILEQAAGIAAHFSEARNSALVPVQMAERKHVRKIKGATPGLVKVDREEVLLVEPRLPFNVQ